MKRNILFAILSIICLVLAQNKLAGWQVDDAAISFSYAKNLVLNGQLTAQPNHAPVEGFSNPLWVFLLAVIFQLGFDHQVVPYFATTLLLLTIFRINFYRPTHPELNMALGITSLMLMMQPSVLIWSLSGLENALVLIAGIELLLRSLDVAVGRSNISGAIIAGLSSMIIALSRPDGIVYIALFPLVVLFIQNDKLNKSLIFSIGIPLLVWLLYEYFRVFYFHDWLPNTYYAKGGITKSRILETLAIGPLVFMRLSELANSLFSWVGAFWASIATMVLVTLSWKRDYKKILLPPLIMLFLALLVYVLLPGDWMGEQRFATLFYPAIYLIISVGILTARLDKKIKFSLISVFVIFSAWNSQERIREFIDNPAISMEEVEDRSRQFESWASKLGIKHASIMTADVGGILWRNKLELLDSGMLTDRLIAKSIGESSPKSDIESLHNYIFEERKPTFIATRAYHSWILH